MGLEWDKNLQQRVISAAIMIPVAIVIVWMGGALFNALLVTAAVLMAFEWFHIVTQGQTILEKKQQDKWMLIGVAYIVIGIVSMIYLRSVANGLSIVMYLLLTVWSIDIAAYFTGKIIGGPKILPHISPKKTWAGLVGGILAAAFINLVIGLVYGTALVPLMSLGAFLAIVAQAGDFFESWVKRYFQVKDSSTLIPGHGGILDRVDGLVFTAPIIALMTLLNGGMMVLWS